MEDQRMSRRDFLRNSAIAAFVMGGLAACTPATQPTPGAGSGQTRLERREIGRSTGRRGGDPGLVCDIINEGHVKVRDKWAADFAAANPGITVQHQACPMAGLQHQDPDPLCGGGAAGYLSLPDGDHAHRDRGAEEYACAVGRLYRRRQRGSLRFRPDAVGLHKWDGKTYALHSDCGNQNIFYNVDLFNEAGVELPPVNWEDKSFTFEVFLDMLQRLVKREGDRVTQWGFLVNHASARGSPGSITTVARWCTRTTRAWLPTRPWRMPPRWKRCSSSRISCTNTRSRPARTWNRNSAASSSSHRPGRRHAQQPFTVTSYVPSRPSNGTWRRCHGKAERQAQGDGGTGWASGTGSGETRTQPGSS